LEQEYGINFRTIHRWVKEAERDLTPVEKEKAKERRSVAIKVRELPADVKELRKELEEAQLKNELLNAMIDIAEGQFGIDIRKKRGAKQ
jgi:transposase-like protein